MRVALESGMTNQAACAPNQILTLDEWYTFGGWRARVTRSESSHTGCILQVRGEEGNAGFEVDASCTYKLAAYIIANWSAD